MSYNDARKVHGLALSGVEASSCQFDNCGFIPDNCQYCIFLQVGTLSGVSNTPNTYPDIIYNRQS